MSNYTPEGDKLDFTFSGVYSPDASKLDFNFNRGGGGQPSEAQYIFPVGVDSLAVGDAHVRLWHTFVKPTGEIYTLFGKPNLRNHWTFILPNGLLASAYGRPVIRNFTTNVNPTGYVNTTYGRPTVRNLLNILLPKGYVATVWGNNTAYNRNYEVYPSVGDQLVFGKTSVRNSDWRVYPNGIYAAAFGSTRVSNYYRVIRPNSIFDGIVSPAATLVNRNRNVAPFGISSLVFGKLDVDQTIRRILADPYDMSRQGMGHPSLRGGVKWLEPKSIDSERIGKASVVSMLVEQQVGPDGIVGGFFGSVAVSPRVIRTSGFIASKYGTPNLRRMTIAPRGFDAFVGFGTHWISTSPQVAKTIGFDPSAVGIPNVIHRNYHLKPTTDGMVTSVFGAAMIYNKNRYIYPVGYEPYPIFEWNKIFNSKKIVTLRGWESERFGKPTFIPTPQLFVGGFVSTEFGTHDVSGGIKTVSVKGIQYPQFPRHTVIGTPAMSPRGFVATLFGENLVTNRTRWLNVPSLKDTSVFGNQTVWLKRRWLNPEGFEASKFGDQFVSHFLRWIEPIGVKPYNRFGTDWVSFAKRYLNPTSIFTEFPSNHIVGGTQFIHVHEGIYGTAFGTRIIPERQTVHPKGMTGTHGLHDVMLRTQFVKPRAFEAGGNHDFFGTQHVWNSRQYVHQYFIGESGLVPPQWSSWTHIWNRNKVIGTIGTRFDKFGYHQIYNNARLLGPKGIEGSTPNAFLVAYRIRDVLPESINEPYFGTWNHVWNNARVISVTGIKPANAYGLATVKNTRRYYPYITLGEQIEWGLPMVAYRVRNIEIERRYSIAPPLIPLPEVKQWRRYVEPLGHEHLGTGVPELRIHWNIIKPRWTHKDLFGDVGLRNVTPEIHAKPLFSEEFGRQTVFNSKQFVTQTDPSTTLYGNHRIEFRTKTIVPVAFHSLRIGNHKVIKGETPPYGLQHIILEKKNDKGGIVDGDGIPYPIGQVGKPSFNINVLRPFGINSFKIGDEHRVQNNTIQIMYGIYEDMFGDVVVQNWRRYLDVKDEGIKPELAYGKPRLSPHTIYAPTGAPQQAIDNHPTGGSAPNPISTGIAVGSPRVMHRHRRITSSGWNRLMFGVTTVGLFKQYINPNGIKSFRIGAVNVGDGRQTVRQFASTDFMVFGLAKLSRPIDTRTFVKVTGFASQQIGTHWVSGWIRNVYPKMWLSQAMGSSRKAEYEYMPQSLHVGPRVPTIPEGFNAEVFGKHWISLRVRDIQMDGFDAFSMDYDYTAFAKRMRVTRKDVLKPHSRLFVAGIEATLFGTTDVKLGARYIRPDGNSDQFRKGVLHE